MDFNFLSLIVNYFLSILSGIEIASNLGGILKLRFIFSLQEYHDLVRITSHINFDLTYMKNRKLREP